MYHIKEEENFTFVCLYIFLVKFYHKFVRGFMQLSFLVLFPLITFNNDTYRHVIKDKIYVVYMHAYNVYKWHNFYCIIVTL